MSVSSPNFDRQQLGKQIPIATNICTQATIAHVLNAVSQRDHAVLNARMKTR
jgi:hypothetical protein